MNKLPNILIIDDIYGSSRYGRNKDREDFCEKLDLQDITGDCSSINIPSPIANVVFCSGQLERSGYIINDEAGTIEKIKQGLSGKTRWALVLLDLHFRTGQIGPHDEPVGTDSDNSPDAFFGLQLIKALRTKDELKILLKDLPIAILSDKNEMDKIEDMLNQYGVVYPVDKRRLNRDKFESILIEYGLFEDSNIVGQSIELLKCIRDARLFARSSDNPVLISGETGTGKTVLARTIHDLSTRASGPFVVVDTSSFPDSLLESELFGHKKGAFTGAIKDKPGKVDIAQGGTLFLDEIADFSPACQFSLLRLIQDKEYVAVGDNKIRKADVRVVTATNKNIFELIRSGTFREDLYYRLKGHLICLPPLRERTEDIPILADTFIKRYSKKYSAKTSKLSPDALKSLQSYDWPGNIRELENIISDSVLRRKGYEVLTAENLSMPFSYLQREPDLVHGKKQDQSQVTATGNSDKPGEIDILISTLDKFQFDLGNPRQWYGKANQLREAFARLMEKYLKTALDKTREEGLDDEMSIAPAVTKALGKLKTKNGTRNYRTPEAYDEIKRLLMLKYKDIPSIISDPEVKKIFERAKKARTS